MQIEIVDVDYENTTHGEHLLLLLDAYARDPMGGGKPLDDEARSRLIGDLSKRVDALSVLAYVDGEPAGLINCFEGYSTFQAKPLLNIHDVVVVSAYRGKGLAQKMLERVEAIARERGCCKLTLEVLSGNSTAQRAYQRFGFEGYQLVASAGSALYWEKALTSA